MVRWSISLLGTIALLGCIAAAQDSPSQLFSSDLVAWSGMQQPTAPEQKPQRQQPTPDPNAQSQPAAVPSSNTQPAPSNSTETSTSPAQTFTGTISKEGDSFTLKVSDTTSYKLDNQQVQQYVGQRVRVTGTLAPASNLIHVERVEPMS